MEFEVGDATFSREDIYDFNWSDINLKTDLVATCTFGGPIAVHKRRGSENVIEIYNARGDEYANIDRDGQARVIHLLWTDEEQLMVFLEDGRVDFVSILGEELPVKSFELFDADNGESLVSVSQSMNGVLCAIKQVDKHKLVLLKPEIHEIEIEGLSDCRFSCIALLHPRHTASGKFEILVATKSSRSVILVEENGKATDMHLEDICLTAPVLDMKVSPDGKKLLCFCEDGTLPVLTTDFRRRVMNPTKRVKQCPDQVSWCGSSAVVLRLGRRVLFFCSSKDWCEINEDEFVDEGGNILLVQEPDCMRVLTEERHELIQEVPKSVSDVLGMGSNKPGSILFDAYKSFKKSKSQADNNIRQLIQDMELEDAVHSCISAALAEFSTKKQCKLLSAAYHGRCFSEVSDADALTDACKTLRVLNSLRNEAGIPLTFTEFSLLGEETVIDRLIYRNLHQFAFSVSKFLMIPRSTNKVLVHWAIEKIRSKEYDQSLSDEALKNEILNIVKESPDLSFAEIASQANASGRTKLAALLLQREPRFADQVPPLLLMGELATALDCAERSGDCDLIFMVIKHLMAECDALCIFFNDWQNR
eukprot:TRINITY_DN3859_c0_g1_i6.p1 TRINITY_DN3859_c0_g1~~TRINITY_DN3859_c0_g1_i6.p1  ORF type:complete len:609 (+),score=89.01 TRINITY_DN3859_c0_g1_i6:60-1829(+)